MLVSSDEKTTGKQIIVLKLIDLNTLNFNLLSV